MIPKIIHYCWFGKGEMSPLEKKCLESWRIHCPEYEIKLWNEDNFDINFCDFSKEAYILEKYAFVSDVARFFALNKDGGFYLDTDMLLLKEINTFLELPFFVGYESKNSINASIIGCEKNHYHVKNLLDIYKSITFSLENKVTIPSVLTSYLTGKDDVTYFSPKVFYPFPFKNRNLNYVNFLQEESVAVHLWNHSWKDKYSYLREGKYLKSLIFSFSEIPLVVRGIIPINQFFRFFESYIRRISKHFLK